MGAIHEHTSLVDDPKTKFKIAVYAMSNTIAATAGIFGAAYDMKNVPDEEVCRAVMDLVFENRPVSTTGGADV